MGNKRVQNAVLEWNLKNDRRISVRFQGKPFNIKVIQVYVPTSNTEEAEVERFCLFHYRGLKGKIGSQETPGVTGKFGLGVQNKAGQRLTKRVLSREREHPLPTTQEKTLHMDITRWPILQSNWLYSLQPKVEKLYTVSKNTTRSWLWLRSWSPYCQNQTEIEESGGNH